jgi:hypothetical protein
LAVDFLHNFIKDFFNTYQLRNIYREINNDSDLARLENHKMISNLARHLVSGYIRIVPLYSLHLDRVGAQESKGAVETKSSQASQQFMSTA